MTLTVSKFTEGFGFIEAANKLLDDNDSNKQRAETIRQGIMRMLACYDENKTKSLSRQAIVLDSKSQTGTRVSSLLLSDSGHDVAGDLPTVQEEIPHPLKLPHVCHFIYRLSQEEWTKLRESVPYVKIYRCNPKHLCPKLNGYGDKGQRKVWSFCGSTYCTWFA